MDILNTFTFENRREICGSTRGYAVFDLDHNMVGVVWSHKHKKGELAEGQAEIHFFDSVKSKYHTWRRIFINEQRLDFIKLEQMIKEQGSVTLTIDPWQGKK